MTREDLCSKRYEALEAFSHIGNIKSCAKHGNGHINDTYLILTDDKRYILQRINDVVFPEPLHVMENIKGITEHIRSKSIDSGIDPERSTLTIVTTDLGDIYFRDSYGSYWRMYLFVERTVAKEKVNGVEDFRCCAEAFGDFQSMLADYPADTLYETIANFHNTPVRFQNLLNAINEDKAGRAASVKEEIEFSLARKDFTQILEKARENKEIPLRVTHNDTKLNNILFDAVNGDAVCVVDLDTVMPGYAVNDFGDAIRFGANTAAEDETDLSKVKLDLDLFEAYTEGFLKGCKGRLTANEIKLLPIGAMMMTFECGMRFLTDHLNGDVYFKIHRENHNLDRCRNQFALLSDMEGKLEQMNSIVKKYY